MKKTIFGFALMGLFMSSSGNASPRDQLIYVCAQLSQQSPESVIANHSDRLEIFQSGSKYKVAGYGELERVNALEGQGIFLDKNSKSKEMDESAFRLANSRGDTISISYDSDAGSKGGTLVVFNKAFELQCISLAAP